jgi:hypothetical protein
MNRKISLAVGTAAAVAFTGVASASDMLTINQTEGYVGAGIAATFIPWVLGECDAAAGATSTIGCPDHGAALVSQAAGLDINFWTGGDAVPKFTDSGSESWQVVGPTGDNPFMSGIFRSDGTSYFSGLTWGWNTPGNAMGAGFDDGMGAPNAATAGANFTRQQEWIDQTLVGYVESIRDANGDDQPDAGGDVTLAQNFRIQFNMTGTAITASGNTIDQRLEQMVELDGATGFLDADASRQTLQQAFATDGASTGNPTVSGGGGHQILGQLIAQDVEGFLFSCLSCDNGTTGGTHASATPLFLEVRYQPYVGGWNVVPTIVHGGQ